MKNSNKKLALLYVLQILQRYSDENHRLTHEAILKILHEKYGVDIERRAVGRNIALLKEAGFEIETNHALGAHLVERDFNDGELRYLIDGVLFSPHIQSRQASDLVEKLAALGSVNFDRSLCGVVTSGETFHEKNSALFINVDELAKAILNHKKVSFEYLEYELAPNFERGEVYSRNKTGDLFTVNPYKLIAHGGNYYLIGGYEDEAEVVPFRVDKIVGLTVLQESAADISQSELAGKKISDYIFEHPYMYAGRAERVQYKIPPYFVDEVISAFGKNARICHHDDWYLRVTVNAGVNDAVEWALQNSKWVELLSPDYLRAKVAKELRNALGDYESQEDSVK